MFLKAWPLLTQLCRVQLHNRLDTAATAAAAVAAAAAAEPPSQEDKSLSRLADRELCAHTRTACQAGKLAWRAHLRRSFELIS